MIAVFALGSNLGDRLGFLQVGVDAVAAAAAGGPVAVSPVYETDPVGGPEQGPYLNAVVRAELPTDTDLPALLTAAESRAGRVRRERWGPRTLDVDLIAVTPPGSAPRMGGLTVPHPAAGSRAFVLAPWADLDPAAVVPGIGAVGALLAGLDRTGIRQRADLALVVR